MSVENVLKLSNITKYYGNKKAVDNASMTIQKGDVYGLIGRNGAGKTTLIRIITALSTTYEGQVELFGKTNIEDLAKARSRMGAVIESPAFYPNLSATQNLEYYQKLKGIVDKEVINNTLVKVGLDHASNKKFKNFSMGMKQRLGIALTLINSPDFIILDEPINGLDPKGVIEFREMIKKLNEEQNMTILISSHLLSELSLVATRYGVIEEGKMVKEFSSEELAKECQLSLSIIVDDVKAATVILETVLKTTNFKVASNNEIRLYDYLDNGSEVNFQLMSNGVRVQSITQIGDSLEDYFMSLIKEGK